MKQEFNWRDYDNYNEWLHDVLETLTESIEEKDKEIDRLNNIIKEVRKYVENDIEVYYVLDTRLNKAFDKTKKVKKDLLEILDKANSKIKEVMPVEELEEYEPKNMAEQEYQDWFWD